MTPATLHDPRVADLRPPDETDRPHLEVGFVPLTDAAPLIVAAELGFFERHGLDVTLSREESWASIRDKLAAGVLDAAQMLAAMPYAMTLGLSGIPTPTIAAFQLSLGGNAITLAESLFEDRTQDRPSRSPQSAAILRPIVDRLKSRGARLTLGAVFPFSSHNYELRTWLLDGGIDPRRDVDIIVVPPPQMVGRLRDGTLHGFCVGEPWNSVAVEQGIGRIVATKQQLWPGSLEKVVAVSENWAQRRPADLQALLAALRDSCRWLACSDNLESATRLLADDRYLRVPAPVIRRTLGGKVLRRAGEATIDAAEFFVFDKPGLHRPDPRAAERVLAAMQRHGSIPSIAHPSTLIRRVCRADLYDRLTTTPPAVLRGRDRGG